MHEKKRKEEEGRRWGFNLICQKLPGFELATFFGFKINGSDYRIEPTFYTFITFVYKNGEKNIYIYIFFLLYTVFALTIHRKSNNFFFLKRYGQKKVIKTIYASLLYFGVIAKLLLNS